MGQKQTLADKLLARLTTLGMPARRAKGVAKGLAPTAARQPVKGTVTGKLEARLIKLGLSERKAKELAPKLAPTVRAAIKAKAKKAQMKLDDVDDQMVEDVVTDGVDEADDPDLDKVAPRVNGHRLRLDLPVVLRSTWQHAPVKGLELLRVVDGLTTQATYLVAAVKGESAMVAIRRLSTHTYNVKFYPDMAYWKKSWQQLASDYDATDHLKREWYERMHFDPQGVERLLKQIHTETKPLATRLFSRLLAVTAKALFKSFDLLTTRVREIA